MYYETYFLFEIKHNREVGTWGCPFSLFHNSKDVLGNHPKLIHFRVITGHPFSPLI